MSVNDYTDLITSEYAQQPNFVANVTLLVAFLAYLQDLSASMIPLFDVDLAVGDQLDIIGEWAGISRRVPVPIPGVFFSWNGTQAEGWNFGTWAGAGTPTTVTVLPDDVYRTLVKAKIQSNKWDGTTESAYAIYDALFPDFTVLIDDHEDMSYDLAIVGAIPDSLTLALLTEQIIPLKPEGVRLNTVYVPVNTGPLFGFDLNNANVQGWNAGSWARAVSPT